jgi:hypothetical protein
VLLSRYEVKKWVFDSFPGVCVPLIDRKNEKKVFAACNVETREEIRVDNRGRGKRKASFISVDDRVVTEAMKDLYKIPLPPAGSGYDYGLKSHGWQALAVASLYQIKLRDNS